MTPPRATEGNLQSHQIKGQHQHLERPKESGNTASSGYAQLQKCRANMAFLHSCCKSPSPPCWPTIQISDAPSIDTLRRWYHPRVESKRHRSPAERWPLPSMAGLDFRKSGSNGRTVARRHHSERTADIGIDADHYCDRVVAGSPSCGAAGKLARCSGYPYYQSDVVTRLRPGGSSSSTAAEAVAKNGMCFPCRQKQGASSANSGRKAHLANLDFRLKGVLRSNCFEPKGVLSRCQTFPSQTFLAGLDLEGWC
jgi:hypothetical protein